MWQAIVGIADKVLGHFTPERNKIRRRNKIDKLEKEQEKLAKLSWTPDRARKFERNRIMLNRLYKESKNE
jgi:hypothetical protein